MYVVSINDGGEERNFLATAINFAGSDLLAVINGKRRSFDICHLIDIENVDAFLEDGQPKRRVVTQRLPG